MGLLGLAVKFGCEQSDPSAFQPAAEAIVSGVASLALLAYDHFAHRWQQR